MASINAYPPSVHHPSVSQPLDITSAHTMLSTFLQLANTDPAYRPDSILSERGPESNSSAGNPNLTLHHLNRIKLGLEGSNFGVEDLEVSIFGKRKATEGRDGGAKKRKWQDRDSATGSGRAGVPKVVSTFEEDVDAVLTVQHTDTEETAANGQDWQDREEFELEQDDGDVDLRNTQTDPAAGVEDVEGDGEEIMDWDIGGMITTQDDLEDGDGAVEVIRPAATADSHPKNREKNQASTRGDWRLTESQKEERKRLKKIRSDTEKKTAQNRGKAEELSKAKSKTPNGNDNPAEASSRPKKKKKRKSLVEGHS